MIVYASYQRQRPALIIARSQYILKRTSNDRDQDYENESFPLFTAIGRKGFGAYGPVDDSKHEASASSRTNTINDVDVAHSTCLGSVGGFYREVMKMVLGEDQL